MGKCVQANTHEKKNVTNKESPSKKMWETQRQPDFAKFQIDQDKPQKDNEAATSTIFETRPETADNLLNLPSEAETTVDDSQTFEAIIKVPKSTICLKSPRYLGQNERIASEVTQMKVDEMNSEVLADNEAEADALAFDDVEAENP